LFYSSYLKINGQFTYDATAYWACIGFAVFYTPMALLATALMDTPMAANPLTVLAAIARIPFHYALTCLFIAGILVLEHAVRRHAPRVPFFTSLLTWFIALYAAMVVMNLLGRVYFLNRKRIGWFREE
jgi:hypothetical protein